MNFGMRINKPGGSRSALRDDIILRTSVMTTTDSIAVDLLTVSKSGARLRGNGLPGPGQEVLVLLGRLEAFGSVIWRDEDQCGIHFDVQLSEQAVSAVQAERGSSSLLRLDGEQRLAASEGFHGLAR